MKPLMSEEEVEAAREAITLDAWLWVDFAKVEIFRRCNKALCSVYVCSRAAGHEGPHVQFASIWQEARRWFCGGEVMQDRGAVVAERKVQVSAVQAIAAACWPQEMVEPQVSPFQSFSFAGVVTGRMSSRRSYDIETLPQQQDAAIDDW